MSQSTPAKHLEDFGFHRIRRATFLRQHVWSCKDTKIQELSSIIKERALTADKGEAPVGPHLWKVVASGHQVQSQSVHD